MKNIITTHKQPTRKTAHYYGIHWGIKRTARKICPKQSTPVSISQGLQRLIMAIQAETRSEIENYFKKKKKQPFRNVFKFYKQFCTCQSKTLRKLANAPWYILNVTLHNDLSIPYVTEVIRTYAKNHKNRTAKNNNQLIRDLFNQREIGRRLNRMWPEDFIR
jgi:hypothetical protein